MGLADGTRERPFSRSAADDLNHVQTNLKPSWFGKLTMREFVLGSQPRYGQ